MKSMRTVSEQVHETPHGIQAIPNKIWLPMDYLLTTQVESKEGRYSFAVSS